MAKLRHGVAVWPGVAAVDSYTYTTSHGVMPGTCILRTLPQPNPPAETGDLTITDGVETVVITDCKCDSIRSYRDGEGFVWDLEIVDRRWKWRDLGMIQGEYNQLDDHGKLIPWTIRSPTELAELCLQAMGETNYSIDLPTGLNSNVGALAAQVNPPWVGVIPTEGTNPPVTWVAEPPALALSRLAAQYGRRVILEHLESRVRVAVAGVGQDLPDDRSIARETPSVKSPETPTGVRVVGAPTVIQARLELEAVGQEWDGSPRRINDLSYAPRTDGAKQDTEIAIKGDATQIQGLTFRVTINGVTFAYQPADGEGAIDVANALINQINGSPNPAVANQVEISSIFGDADNAEIRIVGKQTGVAFTVQVEVDAGPNNPLIGITAEDKQSASNGTADWSKSPPPLFPGVRATDRLNLLQARELAQKTVWKWYQLANYSAEIGVRPAYLQDRLPPVVNPIPLRVPAYGRLVRRQQIILLPDQVEQVVPQTGDQTLRDRLNQPVVLNFYNGYSRSKPAAVYGSISNMVQRYFWNGRVTNPKYNTPHANQVFVPFQIDSRRQLVIFEDHVYFQGLNGIQEPVLILQTGINVRNAQTNAPERMVGDRILPGMKGLTNYACRIYEDVQLNLIGRYDTEENITGTDVLEEDAVKRSTYYLEGMEQQYFQSDGLTRVYNGVIAIDLDEAVSQITWERKEDGVTTTVSKNSEHEVNIPPYAARRRAEFLRAGVIAQVEDAVNPPLKRPEKERMDV